MRKITTWIYQELIHPAQYIWQLSLKYFALLFIASVLIQTITFLVMPNVWLPVKIESLTLKNPKTQINQGKIQNIVLQQHYKKYLAGCAWQMPEIQQLCESAIHHQQLNIQSVQFIYLTTTLQLSKSSKEEIFIQSMILNADHTAEKQYLRATTKHQQLWMQAQHRPIEIIRMLLIMNMLYLAVVFCFKIRNPSYQFTG